jgi:capsular exopolysaccharide synthesis family protein
MVTSLPSLAVIPAQSRSGLMRLTGKQIANRAAAVASLLRPQSEIAEAYRALRTSILLSKTGKAAKILVVTSALPQEGKTTTSVNLAVVLAQQGARVLLIEADMRRADISNVFGFEPEVGLSTVLQRRTLVEAALRKIPGVDKLMLLPAGPAPIYPSELLGSSAMKEMLFDLRQDFDHIVIDTPPVLSVTDPVLLSAMADVTLLVTRAGTTSKVNLRRVRDILSQVDARLLGVVLNAVDLSQSDHYYYNYQGRGYHDSTPVETAMPE